MGQGEGDDISFQTLRANDTSMERSLLVVNGDVLRRGTGHCSLTSLRYRCLSPRHIKSSSRGSGPMLLIFVVHTIGIQL